MKKTISYMILLLAICFAHFCQAQISTKGIDLNYLQKLVRPIPRQIPTSFENISMNSKKIPATKTAFLQAGSDTFHINFIDVFTAGQLRILSDTLDNSNYPLTILHKEVFANYTELLLEYDILVYKYTELEKTADTLQALQDREIKELKSIIALEKEKTNIMRTARDEIMKQAGFLNDQLSNTLEVQKKTKKRNFGKPFFTAAVGGLVGFATGVLFMELAR